MYLGNINFTLGKMLRKEYDWSRNPIIAEHTETQHINNLTEIQTWQNKLYSCFLSRKNPLLRISGDNRKTFRSIFGKPTFTYNGSHYFHCWLIILDEQTQMLLMTARVHGTSYEAVTKRNGIALHPKPQMIIEFLTELAKHIPARMKKT